MRDIRYTKLCKMIKNRQNKSKKSQAEIVGITIVMVLIMLGIIFVIRYVVLPEDYNIKQAFDKTQMAANFMDAVLKTTTTCNTLTITKLVQDCAENYGSVSSQYTCPGNITSCIFLNQSLELVLNSSLNKMPQVNYDFYICMWDDANDKCGSEIISSFPKNYCNRTVNTTRGYEAKQQPIPTDVGNRVAQIYVC